MKAIIQETYGAPRAVLHLRDVDPPAIKDDEVLIRVGAAAVNWADWAMTMGMPKLFRPMYGLRKPRIPARGMDVAGTVEAVGPKVQRLRPGDEVFGSANGAFAEYVGAAGKHLVSKPVGLGFEQAAAVPMAGLVALQAVRDVGRVRPGQQVLVNGASGGIGTFTVQIAKVFGAEVTGVCSTRNADLVRSIGADHVIDYTKEDYLQSGRRYDLILDIPDDRSLAERRRALTPKGTLIPNSGRGGPWLGSLGRIIGARMLSPFVSQKLRPFLSIPKHDDLLALKDLIESGKVTPVIDRSYPLSETADAIAYVGEGHTRGKVVVTI